MSASPAPDQTRVVVADIHGNYLNLRNLLREAGALDGSEERVEGYWVCQIGDLMHCGHDVYEADLETLRRARRWCDVVLFGNHDVFHALGWGSGRFAGMHSEVDRQLQTELGRSVRTGLWQMAAAADGWLITHAGLNPRLWHHLDEFAETMHILRGTSDAVKRESELCRELGVAVGEADGAEAIAAQINELFVERVTSHREMPLFDWVGGDRGGPDPVGGILWASWPGLLGAVERYGTPCPQILGHTALPEAAPTLAADGHLWNIDLAGIETGYVAALRKEPEGNWEPIVLERVKRPLSRRCSR